MILNNTSIRGLYIYNETVDYEKGDFVVDGDCIYICTATEPTNNQLFTVSGQQPSKNRVNFTPYPGDKIATVDEYYTFLKGYLSGDTYETEDKYISSQVLCQILQNMYFGVDEVGVINNQVLVKEDENIDCTVKGILDVSDNILDKILTSKDLNNGIVKVSKNLPEIKSLFLYRESTEISSSTTVLLKQYTYDESNYRVRVQELIDPSTGDTYYRYAKGNIISTDPITGLSDYEYIESDINISSWKSNLSGSLTIQDRLNAINNYYRSTLDDYKSKLNSLRSAFRFSNQINGVKIVPANVKTITLDNSLGTITVLISDRSSGRVFKNNSVTINLLEPGLDSKTKYFITDEIILVCDKVDNRRTKLLFELSDGTTENLEIYITDVYYRCNYEN